MLPAENRNPLVRPIRHNDGADVCEPTIDWHCAHPKLFKGKACSKPTIRIGTVSYQQADGDIFLNECQDYPSFPSSCTVNHNHDARSFSIWMVAETKIWLSTCHHYQVMVLDFTIKTRSEETGDHPKLSTKFKLLCTFRRPIELPTSRFGAIAYIAECNYTLPSSTAKVSSETNPELTAISKLNQATRPSSRHKSLNGQSALR